MAAELIIAPTTPTTLLDAAGLPSGTNDAELSLEREVNLMRALTASAMTEGQMKFTADCLIQLAKIQAQQNKLFTLSRHSLPKVKLRELGQVILDVVAPHLTKRKLKAMERRFNDAIDSEANRPEDLVTSL